MRNWLITCLEADSSVRLVHLDGPKALACSALPWSLESTQRNASACTYAPGLKGGFCHLSSQDCNIALEVPAFLPTLDSSRRCFLCLTGNVIALSGVMDMKMQPVFPKAELAPFLTIGTVVGSSAKSRHTAHAKVDGGTLCRPENGGGESPEAAGHTSSQKNKAWGPKELGSLCFLSCPLKHGRWQGPRGFGLRMFFWKRERIKANE